MAVTCTAIPNVLKRAAMRHYSVAVITWDSEGGSQNPGSIPGSAYSNVVSEFLFLSSEEHSTDPPKIREGQSQAFLEEIIVVIEHHELKHSW